MKLTKIKLNRISKAELEKREMTALQGGACCNCGCAYEHSGGSSTEENHNANYKNGYTVTETGSGGVQKCTYNGYCPTGVGVG